ncbi:Tripartite motif-containing protein 7 [Lonchura striata]|uniref:Tripartite motif-containing protein 7 n=1 Tax=Lonchura striata TaxID=40157 RepID=A0A218U9C6_9PASE|nr:Tripartite motif-containing protein 7 [Lonchura striata domestica]
MGWKRFHASRMGQNFYLFIGAINTLGIKIILFNGVKNSIFLYKNIFTGTKILPVFGEGFELSGMGKMPILRNSLFFFFPFFQGVVPAGGGLESWMFLKPEPGFSELEKKLKSFSQKSAVLKEVLLEFKENLRFELENDTAELCLDPDTANPYLVLSEDKRSVRLRGAPQELPPHPKRFDYAFCVLTSEGFSAGRHYWEVEVGDGESWVLGAARESVRRKEKVDFAPEEGIWAVGLNWKGKNWDQYQAFTSPETPLSLCERPRKVGVYLDYEGGWVAFYNADSMAPIFTFTAAFSERIFPFFWLFYVGSSLSLCN